MLHTVIDRNFGHKTFAFRGDQGYRLYAKLMEKQDAETLEYCASLKSHFNRMIFVLRGVYGFGPDDILNAAETIFDVRIRSEDDRRYVHQTVYNVKRKFQINNPNDTKFIGFNIDGREQRRKEQTR